VSEDAPNAFRFGEHSEQRFKISSFRFLSVQLLPSVTTYPKSAGKELVCQLPHDELVVVVQTDDSKQRETLTRVASLLRSHGHHVRLVEEQELTLPRSGDVAQESLRI
jgi:hypothetical protein